MTPLHWVYVLFVLIILVTMILKRDTIIPCILGIFVLALMAKGSLIAAMQGVFNAIAFAGARELFDIILVIALIVAMSKAMEEIGANTLMVAPFRGLIRTPSAAFWVMGIVMALSSWFFWPSPSTALVGAVLLPVALRVGLPAIGAAMAMNLFGHGLALSGDFIIQGAPKITSSAAGIDVTEVISASYPLVFIMGAVTISVAFYFLMRDIKAGKIQETTLTLAQSEALATAEAGQATPVARFAAVLVPILFLVDIVAMFVSRGTSWELKGGDATALLGATAVTALVIINFAAHGVKALDKITDHIKSGFIFGISVFGPILPIAGFFYLGESGLANIVLGKENLSIFQDVGKALASAVPLNAVVAAFTQTIIGGITGLDGSGFSGINLAGSLAQVFGTAINGSVAHLTALGQISAIWIGGGTVVPWGLIPAAAIAGVNPIDLARRNFLPVMIGLLVTTIVAIFFI